MSNLSYNIHARFLDGIGRALENGRSCGRCIGYFFLRGGRSHSALISRLAARKPPRCPAVGGEYRASSLVGLISVHESREGFK
jgi:hypothetical protein